MTAVRKSPQEVRQAWAEAGDSWQPLDALEQAGKTRWVVDGVIPAGGIVWFAGAPACGKTFALIDMGLHVAAGLPWQGRHCEPTTVIYLAAEGGNNIKIRSAAAQLAGGATGPFLIQQARPRIDTPEGLAELMSLVYAATDGGIRFGIVSQASDEVFGSYDTLKYLEPGEKDLINSAFQWRDLMDRKESGERLTQREVLELERLGQQVGELRREHGLPVWHDAAPDAARACKTFGLDEWCMSLSESRLPPEMKAAYKHVGCIPSFGGARGGNVLLVIDTYSQTAASDEKVSVGAYMKNLRELAEQSERGGGCLSIVVVDHLTKSGESFMGANAKLGDSDAMIWASRRGDLVTLTCPDKMKDAEPFAPIHLALASFVLEGFADGLGRPLSSLVIKDGSQKHKLRKAAGNSGETVAAIILKLLNDNGNLPLAALQDLYVNHAAGKNIKPESAKRAFSRAIADLVSGGVVDNADGVVSFSLI